MDGRWRLASPFYTRWWQVVSIADAALTPLRADMDDASEWSDDWTGWEK